MTAKRSAGLLLFRRVGEQVEVLVGHMGGPFWAAREAGAWTVPKGEYAPGEDPQAAARREFAEELGVPPPVGPLLDLGSVRQAGGKVVAVWALETDLDLAAVVPGTFRLEWPPRSGRFRDVPELDRLAWLPLARARELVVTAQRAFLDRLAERLGG